MTQKRDRPRRLLVDDLDLHLPLWPASLAIANLLPADVEAPDWYPRSTGAERKEMTDLVIKAKDALARVGIDVEREEAARFERFLNEHFPREQFAEFRDMVDGPDLAEMAARKQGWETVAVPRSKLSNYRFIIGTRRTLRDAASIVPLISRTLARRRSSRTRTSLPPLRICEWRQCRKLFVAERNNEKWCSDKCGDAFRQALKRKRAKDYALQAELNISHKQKQKKLKGKGGKK